MESVFWNSHEMPWEPAPGYPHGAQARVLRSGEKSGGWTIILKLPAGWHMGSHYHQATEQHYVLEGEYEMEGQVFREGSYQLFPKGTHHGPIFTLSGVTLLVIWDGDLKSFESS